MDLLSQILDHAAWENDLLLRAALYDEWAYTFPCDHSGGFHVVTQGSCYLRQAERVEHLQKGDLVFVLKGVHHDLCSRPDLPPRPIDALPQAAVNPATPAPEKQPLTTLVTVRYETPKTPQHPFFRELPEILVIRADSIPIGHPIHSTVEMISREMAQGIASDLIIQRLADILLYCAIRRWLESVPTHSAGWVTALRDEKILAVLELIHERPLRSWTIEELATSIGVSRAWLAARFKKSLSITVMEYISRMRLEKGRAMLSDAEYTLEEIARETGYSSAFAFSKAFKRVFGASPRMLEASVS